MTQDESAHPALQTLVDESRFLSCVAQEMGVKASELEIRERGGVLPKDLGGDRCPDLKPNSKPADKVEFYLGLEKTGGGNKYFTTRVDAVVAAARTPLEIGTYSRSPDLIRNDEVLLPILMVDSQSAAKLVLVKVTIDEWLHLSKKAGEWRESHLDFFPEAPMPSETKTASPAEAFLQKFRSLVDVRRELGIDPKTVGEQGRLLGTASRQIMDNLQQGFDQGRFQVAVEPRGRGLTSHQQHIDYLARLTAEAGIDFDEYAQTQLVRNTVGLAGLAYNYLNEQSGLVQDADGRQRLLSISTESLDGQTANSQLKNLEMAAMILYRQTRGESLTGQAATFNQAVKGYVESIVQRFTARGEK